MAQSRAARTRELLILAAAAEIDRNGYRGATIAGICKAAGVSMGALTFHFANKAELAQAVGELGARTTRGLTAGLRVERPPVLWAVGAVTRGIARLLEDDVVVRSAARLARERPEAGERWSSSWSPVVCGLLERADEAGELRPGTVPQTVTDLVEYLLTGVEAHPWAPSGPAGAEGVVSRLDRVWPLIERAVACEKA
jgi:AcrR family transcriptional regulator